MQEYPFVSVIVPVLNREKVIGECIESLLEMDYPSYEIIIVDNGSTDKTREVISRHPVKLVIDREKGPYRARMTGVRIAQGEIIAFTDSDCVVDKDWLKNIVKNYTDVNISGVGGPLCAYKPKNWIEKFLSFGTLRIFHSHKRSVMKQTPNIFLSGALGSANMSYRKSVLEEVNGFCSDFIMFCGAYDLCWRVQRAGYKVIYEPEALVWHKLRSSLGELIKQFYNFGKCQLQLLKKQPGNFSYIKIKTYLFPAYEFKFKLPIQMLVTFDFCNLLIIALLLIFVSSYFGYLALGIFLAGFAGTLKKTFPIVKKTGEWRWLLLYPILYLIQNYALMAGRIVGGIKYRVISI